MSIGLFFGGYAGGAERVHGLAEKMISIGKITDYTILTFGLRSAQYCVKNVAPDKFISFEFLYEEFKKKSNDSDFSLSENYIFTNSDLISDRVINRTYHDELYTPLLPETVPAITKVSKEIINSKNFTFVYTHVIASFSAFCIIKMMLNQGVKLYNLVPLRVPNGFFLCEDIKDTQPVVNNNTVKAKRAEKREFNLADKPIWADKTATQKLYSGIIDNFSVLPFLGFSARKKHRAFFNVDQKDPYHYVFTVKIAALRKLVFIYRSAWYWFYFDISKKNNQSLKGKEGRAIVYFLHIDPEASTATKCPGSARQVDSIYTFADKLPLGTIVYVKEHPAMKGKRSPTFYKRLLQHPFVRFVDKLPNDNEFLAVSATGSIALERALKGLKSVLFCETVFSKIFRSTILVDKLASREELRKFISEKNELLNDGEVEKYEQFVSEHAWHDKERSASVWDNKNLYPESLVQYICDKIQVSDTAL